LVYLRFADYIMPHRRSTLLDQIMKKKKNKKAVAHAAAIIRALNATLKVHRSRKPRGGARPGCGRKPKENKNDYVMVTCQLRKDTVEELRARSAQWGAVLQQHLDRFPLPPIEVDGAQGDEVEATRDMPRSSKARRTLAH
jgi:hypothetical protein